LRGVEAEEADTPVDDLQCGIDGFDIAVDGFRPQGGLEPVESAEFGFAEFVRGLGEFGSAQCHGAADVFACGSSAGVAELVGDGLPGGSGESEGDRVFAALFGGGGLFAGGGQVR
jgi:hypothetical protein